MSAATPGATSIAVVTTPMAERYLKQMCKHFAHKRPVAIEAENSATIELSSGLCHLNAQGDVLTISLSAITDDLLAELQKTVANHLLRFAFREQLQVEWRNA
ncbi:MAG: DUF2218 domain-containing protein [Hyphomicrobiales bacterium]|nr:DUF2218 domain-containing protein [Hyphomicrobiales bacterium]